MRFSLRGGVCLRSGVRSGCACRRPGARKSSYVEMGEKMPFRCGEIRRGGKMTRYRMDRVGGLSEPDRVRYGGRGQRPLLLRIAATRLRSATTWHAEALAKAAS